MTTNGKTPRNNAGESPRVLNTLDTGFLTNRRSDGKERVLRVGEGFGTAKPKAAAPNPGSDPRGERSGTVIKRDPPQPDNSGKPVRIVGASSKR